MAVKIEHICSLFERHFDYLLILDDESKIVHISNDLAKETTGDGNDGLTGRHIDDVFSGAALDIIRSTIRRFEQTDGPELITWETGSGKPSIPLRAVMDTTANGRLFMLWGNRFMSLENVTYKDDWKRLERAKELACIYAVAEWIEVSKSTEDFFTHLPRYLRDGMHHPEHVLVYSVYQGREYGKKPDGEHRITTDLVIEDRTHGRICVAYDTQELEFLPEKQRMLDELARMLVHRLEKKELRENIDKRKDELHRQKSKLETLNSYLDRINRGFEESKTRLATIFQAIPDTVAIIDRERNVVMTNTDKYIPGNKCYKTFFDSDTPCLDCRLAKVVKQRTPITLEIQHDARSYEVHALPIFDKDHVVDGIIEFYRDISDKKNYERQLQQADKLASLGQLVSGIGHEINNPNQFIRGNVKIIAQAMEDILPLTDAYYESHADLKIARLNYDFFRKHIITLIKDMARGSERIKGIVESLKRFARKDEGLLIDKVDLNAIIREGVRLVHNQIHKTADVELTLSDDLPEFIGNVQKIEQVFINLIINAGQAFPEDRRGLIEVVTKHDDTQVIAEVRDSGSGMSEGTIKQIFDPFFTTKRARGGTGLGLSIVYRIVEEHGGTIAVSSRIGEGTTFTIRIPYRRQHLNVGAGLSGYPSGKQQ
ncbi:MAG: PAS domain-containing protein [Phycisphaerae bacterium]|nr:PAS domain-containing protein [Phycisphaerae bacterium]